MRSQRKMLGIGVALVAVLLMFAGQVPATTYTTVGSGDWSNGAIWSGGIAPGGSDTGEITNGYTVNIAGDIGSTARVDTGGTLALTALASMNTLYLEGGTVSLAGNTYASGASEKPVYVDVNSYVTGTGSTSNGFGNEPNYNGVLLHGSANLTLAGVYEFGPTGTSYGTVDFSGTYIVQSVAGGIMRVERSLSLSNWDTGSFAIAGGATLQQGWGNGNDTAITYHHTISGSGTWTIPQSGNKLTLGSGAIVRPGAANAADAATLTLQGPSYNYEFASGSDVQMDITGQSTNDLLLFPTSSSAVVTIDSGAVLDVNLFTPSGNGTITNMVLWDANYTGVTLTGSYGTINYNNAAGWTGLSVVETGNQILFNGTYTAGSPPVPEPATLLLVGTGVLGVFGYIRRRRMS